MFQLLQLQYPDQSFQFTVTNNIPALLEEAKFVQWTMIDQFPSRKKALDFKRELVNIFQDDYQFLLEEYS
jgi:hypothetical protein